MGRKIPVNRVMRVQAFSVVARAVEEGVRYGWRRAHKYADKPDEDAICEAVESAVMNAICEVVDFGDGV